MKKKLFVFLSLICFAFISDNDRPTHVFMIGDSTMANKPENAIPEVGWGQVLHYFFNDSIVIENHAKNGRSSKSFIDEGLWGKVIASVQKGDYVIIQFGHNDEKEDTARHTNPSTSYKKNLERFVDETNKKGGIPILCTSIVRRHFDKEGTLRDTHGEYLKTVRQVALEKRVYFIDLEKETRKLVEQLGPEKSKQLYLFFESGVYPLRPIGLQDSTHLSQLGAFTVAGLAVEGMKELDIPLIKYQVH
jgi:lysophospholipase L1-like esterase